MNAETLRRIFDSVPIGIYETTPEGRGLSANQALAGMLGYETADELIAAVNRASVGDVVYADPQGRPAILADVERAGDAWRTFQTQFRRRDGGVIDVLLTVSVTADDTPDGARLFGFVEDITERAAAETRLRESEERYRLLLENANDAVFVHQADGDRPGRIVEVNAQACRLLGYTRDELLQMEVGDIDVAEQRERHSALMRQLYDNGRAVFRTEHVAKDGHHVPVEVSTRLFQLRDRPTVLSVVRDISAQLEAQRALSDSEQRFRELAEAAPVGLYLTDPAGRVTYVNPEWCALTGLAPEYALGVGWRDVLHVDDRRRIGEAWREAVTDGSAWATEYRYVNERGEVTWVQGAAAPVRRADGTVGGYVGVDLDITQRKQAEEALSRSEEVFKTVADFTRDWEYWRSPQGEFLYVSPSCERITGYRADEFLSDPELLTRIIHPEDRPAYDRHAQKTHVEDGVTEEVRFRIIARSGETRWVGHVCRAVHDSWGVYRGVRGSNRDITAHEQVAEALRRSEETLRTLVENVPGVVFRCEVRPPWLLLYVSDGFTRLTGHAVADAVGGVVRQADFILPEDFADVQRAVAEHVARDEPYSIVYRIRHTDGSVHWVNEIARCAHDEHGNQLHIDGIFFDVTERTRVEQALQESEQKFRTIADFTLDWEYWRAVDGTFVYVSPSVTRVTGRRPEEFLADPKVMLQVVHPEDRYRVERHIAERLGGRCDPGELEFRIVTPSGEVRWVSHVCQCVSGRDGEPLGVRASNRDVTEHKHIEDALRGATAEMERQRDFLEALLDMVPSPVLQQDRNLSLGDVAHRVLQEARVVVGARSLAVFIADESGRIVETHRDPESRRRVPPEMVAIVQWVATNRAALGLSRGWLRTSQAGRRLLVADAADVEFAVLSPGEMYIPVLTASRCYGVLWVDGPEEGLAYSPRTTGLLVAVANLLAAFIERRALQEAAARANDRRQADELRTALLSSVSHQLKTPLAGLTATITNLLEGDVDWDEANVRAELNAALRDISRLGNSIGSLLDLSRLEAHAWEPRWDWHDVEDLLETAVLSVPSSDRGRIEVSPPDDPVTAYGDFEQIVRALQSLLENAVVYAGADVPVRIGADAAPGMLRLWVEDEGPGIPEQERERVFEKFYRTPEGAKVPSGTGLGLAITREIVTAHGGEVRVEEVAPHGARFVVELPQPLSDAEVGPGRREKP